MFASFTTNVMEKASFCARWLILDNSKTPQPLNKEMEGGGDERCRILLFA